MLNWASRADATPAARHVRLVSNCIGIQDQHASRNPAILHLPFRVAVGVRCRSEIVAQGRVKPVSGTYKHLKLLTFSPAYNALTFRSSAKNFRLTAIEAERPKVNRRRRDINVHR